MGVAKVSLPFPRVRPHVAKIGQTTSTLRRKKLKKQRPKSLTIESMSRHDRDPDFKTHNILNDYDIKWHRNLGTGISGPVRLCVHKETGREYALKVLLDRPKARQEVTLHWLCSGCESVVQVVDVFANEVLLPGDSVPKKRILLVMELMEGGELFEYITRKKNFTEREASIIMRQVAQAVLYCHRRNIAHRDLKPENLLLLSRTDDPDLVRIKLADFGFAKIDNGNLTTPQFTPYYVAPQILEAQKRQKDIRTGHHSPGSPYFYDKSCDMWSLGVILYIMLCGYPPFYSEIPNQPITQRMKRRIMSGDFDFPEKEWTNISPFVKDLIRKLLCVEASERITIDSLLQHPWLVSSTVPSHDLPSPGILLDRAALQQAKAVHSEFLQDMRREQDGFYLKPVGKSQCKLLTNRQKKESLSAASCTAKSSDSGSPSPSSHEESLQTLKELRDICVMPPPPSQSSAESYADSVLVEGVKKALTFNESSPSLSRALLAESWNGKEFSGMVNRKRLALSLQNVIDCGAVSPVQPDSTSPSVLVTSA